MMQGIQAELLTETTELHFQRMLTNPDYGYQEKHNGHRLMIAKQDGQLFWFNREGEKSSKALPIQVRHALLSHPLDTFVIDGELVKTTFFVFDALILGDEVITNDVYEYREARYHQEFDNHSKNLITVKTARTAAEKKALWEQVLAAKGEGIVSKNLRKSYRTGRAEQHFKLKFWKMADAFVIGPSPEGKDSVEIGMVNSKGQVHRISGCSLRNKFNPAPGQVIEVRFLYATQERHIVQPTLLHLRNDKRAADCHLSQLEPYINKNWATK
jgi:ATP-dependent DNA ligase